MHFLRLILYPGLSLLLHLLPGNVYLLYVFPGAVVDEPFEPFFHGFFRDVFRRFNHQRIRIIAFFEAAHIAKKLPPLFVASQRASDRFSFSSSGYSFATILET